MIAFVSLFACLLAFSNVVYSATSGKVAFWDGSAKSQESSAVKFTTRNVNIGRTLDIPSSLNARYEAVIFLNSGSTFKNQVMLDDIRSSSAAEVMSDVSTDASIHTAIANGALMTGAQILSTQNVIELLKQGVILSDKVVNSYTVSDADTSDLKELFILTNALPAGKVLFIAAETTSDAAAPQEAGNYQRHLSDERAAKVTTTASTSTATAPATGAEFSIYYEGTYLYITPDIFTGLMTGIFMFFVVLIGMSCLGSIQGMSSFYDKVPSNGKEA